MWKASSSGVQVEQLFIYCEIEVLQRSKVTAIKHFPIEGSLIFRHLEPILYFVHLEVNKRRRLTPTGDDDSSDLIQASPSSPARHLGIFSWQ